MACLNDTTGAGKAPPVTQVDRYWPISNFMVSKFFGFSFAWQLFCEFTLLKDFFLKKFHSFLPQLLQNSLLNYYFCFILFLKS
jgi:hypothetical protein